MALARSQPPPEATTTTIARNTNATAIHADDEWVAALDRNDAADAGAVLDAGFESTKSDGPDTYAPRGARAPPALAGDLRGERDIQRYHYEHVHIITSGRPGPRHPDPVDWAPYVLDDVYYVAATAQLSKADGPGRLTTLKENGAPSVPGDPVASMRIHDFGGSAS